MTLQRAVRALIVGEQAPVDMVTAALDQLQVGPIEHASNGAAALSMMRERHYGLVISDWFMGPVSGLQLLKFIRAEPAFAQVCFLIKVPRSEGAAEASARQAGASEVLVEPYSLESLANTIRSALGE